MNSSLAYGDSHGEDYYISKLQALRSVLLRSIDEPSLNSSTNSSRKGQIDDLLRCIICFSKVKNPQMCPSCSKLCCNHCIKRWLTEQKSQCPHCRCPLRISQLVNCRFVSEIASVIDQIHTKKEDEVELCHQHQVKLSYYCQTCETPICADCAMFGTDHKNHHFEHISKVYESHVELVKNEALSLKARLKSLNSHLASVASTIEQVTRAKEEKAAELGLIFEQMNQKLESELKSKLVALLSQKGAITDEIEFLESLQGELNRQLLHSPKNILIVKSIELVKMLREINSKPMPKYNKYGINADFKSEIVPEYVSAVFYLRPFSLLRQNTEVVYSEPLNVNGVIWRLKVYPNGNGQAKNEHLSVFLEVVKGLQELSKYEYKVEMINQRNPDIVTIREFASEFETGECWGYNKFFKIDQLEREGYLVPEEDMIVLKYFVRAPTYYQECQDQKRYIQHLEKLKNQSSTIISELKAKLNQESARNRKMSEMNPSLMSALKNSISPVKRDEKNDDLVLVKMSPQSDQQNDSINQNEEEDIDFEDEQEEEDYDEDQIRESTYQGEECINEQDLDLPSTERVGDQKHGLNFMRGMEISQEASSPLQEECKYPDLYENNFGTGELAFQYAKLDAFLKTDRTDFSGTDQEGTSKEPFSKLERLAQNETDDNLQLESLHESSPDEPASLEEFCENIHANLEVGDNLKPIDIDNIFNIKSMHSDNESKVTKNLLSAFNAEVPSNSDKNEKKTDRFDKNFLQLSDSLIKRLGGLKNLNSKEQIIDKSLDGKQYIPSVSMAGRTGRMNENEKENKM